MLREATRLLPDEAPGGFADVDAKESGHETLHIDIMEVGPRTQKQTKGKQVPSTTIERPVQQRQSVKRWSMGAWTTRGRLNANLLTFQNYRFADVMGLGKS